MALIFRQLFDPQSSTYTYLLACGKSREAVLIDTVFEQVRRDAALIDELGFKLLYTLETHVHADHVTGAWLFKRRTRSRIAVPAAGGAEGADIYVKHGDKLRFGTRHLEARATPGHTHGCTSYVLDDESMAFTGDTLLIRGCGRTDFQQGESHDMYRSVHLQLFTLPDTCTIYPGHDYRGLTATSVAEEKRFNPRLGGSLSESDFVGYMSNLKLAHPKKIDVAVPANLRSGKPENGKAPRPADWGPVRRSYAGLLEIDPEWVAEHLAEVHVLDVRQPEELADRLGRIATAQCVPLNELKERLAEIPKDKPVIPVCHAGMRSGQATVILRDAGFPRVANLHGGMLLWQQMGLPVLRGTSTLPK